MPPRARDYVIAAPMKVLGRSSECNVVAYFYRKIRAEENIKLRVSNSIHSSAGGINTYQPVTAIIYLDR